MVKVCAWCGHIIEYCIQGTEDDNQISHVVCSECANVIREKESLTKPTKSDTINPSK
jgi:hypothetical protein